MLHLWRFGLVMPGVGRLALATQPGPLLSTLVSGRSFFMAQHCGNSMLPRHAGSSYWLCYGRLESVELGRAGDCKWVLNCRLCFFFVFLYNKDVFMWTCDWLRTHLQAVLNPLQAFLNSIVYRGVGLCYQRVILRETDDSTEDNFARLVEGSASFTGMNADESSPLLRPLDKPIPISWLNAQPLISLFHSMCIVQWNSMMFCHVAGSGWMA